jgi:DNA-binding beta-propeller fold protein YncE
VTKRLEAQYPAEGGIRLTALRDSWIGTDLLGYRIEALVGRGGMGVVYRAFDSRLKRNVALKLLVAELAADEGFRERFLRESELAASLDHPNVVPIYEAGEADGRIFIAMRYVDGSDLKLRLEDGPLALAKAIEIAAQIAGALDAAHDRGLVHRDVKPSNVLIAPGAGANGSDHVYLSDFGLTRRVGEPIGTGASAEPLLATLDYVAPEQIRGDEVDGRADVYSFGCLLYECLTGEPPFRASSEAALLFAHLEQDPPRPSERGFSELLDPVIQQALAKDPDDRYETARELVDDAREALGIAAPAVRAWWRAPALFAAAGITLVAVSVAAYVLTRGAPSPQPLPGADSLVRIDARTNKVVHEMPVGRRAGAVTTGDGYVWVTSFADDSVWRIDAASNRVLKIPAHGTPTGIAVAGGSALVVDGPGNDSVVSMDTRTGAVTGVTTLPGDGGAVPRFGAGAAGIWLADPEQYLLTQADNRGQLSGSGFGTSIPANRSSFLTAYVSFDGLAVGEGAVWIAGDSFGRTVWRVDSVTRKLTATIPLSFVPAGIAAGEGAIWVTSLLGDTVSRIDTARNRIVQTVAVGRGAGGVATGLGAVWVASSIDGTVSKLDPITARLLATIDVGVSPVAVTVGEDAVWVVGHPR